MTNNNLILIVAVVLGVFLLSGGITGNFSMPTIKQITPTTTAGPAIKTAPNLQQQIILLPNQVNALSNRVASLEKTCADSLGSEEYAELWSITNRLEIQLEESGLPLVAGNEPGCVCVYSRAGVIGAYALCQSCTQSTCASICGANTPTTGKGVHESGTCYEKLC